MAMNKRLGLRIAVIVGCLIVLAVYAVYSVFQPWSGIFLRGAVYAVFPIFKPAPYQLPRGHFCEVVSIPAPWKIRDTRYTWTILPPVFTSANDGQSFEFRRIGSRFAVAVQAGSVKDPQYSVNKFSFDPAHPAQLTSITDEVWNRAAPIAEPPSWFVQWRNNLQAEPRDRTLRLQGRQFRASGESFPDRIRAFLLSPQGAWLALQSFDGHVSKTPVDIWGGIYPLDGSYYLDVYNVHSRKSDLP